MNLEPTPDARGCVYAVVEGHSNGGYIYITPVYPPTDNL